MIGAGLALKVALAFTIGVGGYPGILGHYNPGQFARTAAIHGLTPADCHIASDRHPLGATVRVYGVNTGVFLECQVSDYSKAEDLARHLHNKLFESDFHSALLLCGRTDLANRDCRVFVNWLR